MKPNNILQKRIMMIFIIVFSIFNSLHSQTEEELREEIKVASWDHSINVQTRKLNIEELLEKARSKNYKKAEMQACLALASIHFANFEVDDNNKLIQYVDSLLKIYPDYIIEAKNAFAKATSANLEKKHAVAQEELNKIYDAIVENKDTSRLIDWHCHMSRILTDIQMDKDAMQNLIDAHEINTLYNSPSSQANINLTRAGIFMTNKKEFSQEAIDEFKKAEKYYESVTNNRQLLPIKTNIMTLLMYQKKFDEALVEMADIGEIRKVYGSQVGYYTWELNKINLLVNLERFEEAKVQAQKCIDYGSEKGLNIAHALYWYGVVHRGLDQYGVAEDYIERAFNLGVERKHIPDCAFYSHALYQTYFWKNKYKEALDWHRTYTTYKDSLKIEENLKEVEILNARYEKLESRRMVIELEAKAKIEKEKKRQLWIGLLMSMLLGGFLVYSQMQKRKKDKIIKQSEMKALELEKLTLERELNFNQKELTSQVLHLAQKNATLSNIKSEIEELKKLIPKDRVMHLESLQRSINRNLDGDDDWNTFLSTFKNVHHTFLDKLNAINENLTSNDIKVASLMKMNLSGKEIGSLLNISDEGVKKARYRLRKKLNLESSLNVQDYLLRL